MGASLKVIPGGMEIPIRGETPLLEALRALAVPVPLPCGARGVCGRCRVRFLKGAPPPTPKERELIGEAEILKGVRLACLCSIKEDAVVLIPQQTTHRVPCPPMPPPPEKNPAHAAAVDVGTSTVYILHGESCLKFWNPQGLWGPDVASRIQHALEPQKRRAMAKLLKEQIVEGLRELSFSGTVGVSGNPVMLAILEDDDLTPLSRFPFSRGKRGFRTKEWQGIKALFLPEIGGFLGADALSMLTATLLSHAPKPYMAMDMGTNTELFLVGKERVLGTSLPAGPAFEGYGISSGSPAVKGAIYEVEEDLSFKTIEGAPETGICGSGIISAVHALKKRGFIDETGLLLINPYRLGRVTVKQEDVRALQLAKAAVFAGVKLLLEEARVAPKEVKTLFICGNFGGAVKEKWLFELGFFPEGFKPQVIYLGNTSLWGALWAAVSSRVRKLMESLKSDVEVLQLAEREDFQKAYLEGMRL